MNLEPAPRLSKSIFLIIDAVLLLTAFLIVYFNTKNPYAPLPFVSAVLCVVMAAIVALIPFLIDFSADSAEYVQAERERVSEQVQRLHAAGESLARAAAQIKAVEEAVHKAAHTAENLPYRMQEKLAEFNEALAGKEEDDREALEQELVELRAANSAQLKAVADKIHLAVADWTKLEANSRKHLAAAEAALAHLQGASTATRPKIETPSAPPAHESMPPSSAPVAAAPTELVTPPVDASALPVALEDAEPKLKKPRAPRKPKTEAIAELSENPESELSRTEIPPESLGREESTAPTELMNREPAESASSSDGATRLLATAYIGIGNKLFIRGEGPGLSWDRGAPMQFVSIGKWGWSTNDATAAITCKLYKNDETEALTGEVTLEPGKHVEVTALF